MHATLTAVLAPLDRAAVERERDELREQLADCEALLRLIDRHQPNSNGKADGNANSAPTGDIAAEGVGPGGGIASGQAGNGNGNGRLPATRKRDAVLAMLRERPGRWSTADVRAALAEQGIDPRAGTPVKNIMWKLAKDRIVHASGNGVYEFPALNERATPDEQEAMGL